MITNTEIRDVRAEACAHVNYQITALDISPIYAACLTSMQRSIEAGYLDVEYVGGRSEVGGQFERQFYVKRSPESGAWVAQVIQGRLSPTCPIHLGCYTDREAAIETCLGYTSCVPVRNKPNHWRTIRLAWNEVDPAILIAEALAANDR